MLKVAVSILELAYPERFELPLAVLETVVLPLNTKDTLIGSHGQFRNVDPRLIKTMLFL